MLPDTPLDAPLLMTQQPHAEELGLRLQRVLSPLRVQSLSLHDVAAEVLWLSAGALGPDEHTQILSALDVFTLEPDRMQLWRRLDDGRCALFLAARDPFGERCGLALAILDGRGADEPAADLARTPRVAAVLRRFSALLAPSRNATVSPADPAHTLPVAATMGASGENGPGGLIHARRYARLRAGGSTRRYELTLPAGDDPGIALHALQRLLDFLIVHRERYQREPASFLLPLPVATVLDGSAFLGEVETRLLASEVAPSQLGFCIPQSAWSQHPDTAVHFMNECAGMGCFVALDDFNWNTGAARVLAAPTLRCLKLDPQLTARAMTDKLAQALLAAVVQAARVLGLYCVARQVESGQAAQWLASAGVEFADPPQRDMGATSTRSQRIPLQQLA